MIEYERTFSVDYDFTGTVTRLVECDGLRTFDVAGISRTFTEGQKTTHRTFSVPFRYPEGADCKLRTFIAWHPSGAFREQVEEIKPVGFKVVAPPRGRKMQMKPVRDVPMKFEVPEFKSSTLPDRPMKKEEVKDEPQIS